MTMGSKELQATIRSEKGDEGLATYFVASAAVDPSKKTNLENKESVAFIGEVSNGPDGDD